MALKNSLALHDDLNAPGTPYDNTAFTGFQVGDKAPDDWNVSNWTFAGEPIPEEELVNPYASGTTFNETFDFTEGVRGGDYRDGNKRIGTGKVGVSIVSAGYGADVVITGGSVGTGHTGHTVDVQVTGEANANVTHSASGWFDGFTEPNAPSDNDPHDIRFTASVNNQSPVGDSVIDWMLFYTMGGAGGFNDTLTRNQGSKFEKRQATNNDYDYEWHNNSSYTDLYASTRETIWTQSVLSEDKTFWHRKKRKSARASWENIGAVTFTDPRDPL